MQFFFLSSEDIYLKLDRSKDHMTYIGSTNMSNGRSKTVWCFHFLFFYLLLLSLLLWRVFSIPLQLMESGMRKLQFIPTPVIFCRSEGRFFVCVAPGQLAQNDSQAPLWTRMRARKTARKLEKEREKIGVCLLIFASGVYLRCG